MAHKTTRPAQSRPSTPARPAARAPESPVRQLRGPQKKPGAAPPPGPPAKVRPTNTLGEGKPTPFVFPEDLKTARPRRDGTYRVRATEMGYIHHERKREGDVFDVTPEEYSTRWMEPADPRERLKTTGPQADINRKHDDIIRERGTDQPANDGGLE